MIQNSLEANAILECAKYHPDFHHLEAEKESMTLSYEQYEANINSSMIYTPLSTKNFSQILSLWYLVRAFAVYFHFSPNYFPGQRDAIKELDLKMKDMSLTDLYICLLLSFLCMDNESDFTDDIEWIFHDDPDWEGTSACLITMMERKVHQKQA